MKKILCFMVLINICIFALFAIGDKKYVAVEKSYIKSSTWFFAKKISSVFYGDAVEIVEEKGNWTKIRLLEDTSVIGWISDKSLTSKKIVLRDNNRLSTSTEELALAGKGFSQEIENSYKTENKIDFSLVDNMENLLVDEDGLVEFITEGNLQGVAE